MIFQTARPWIPQAGIARRLGVSPRVIRRLVDCGDLTVRRIPGCQARVLTDDVDRSVAQHARPASASDWANIPPVLHIEKSNHAIAYLPTEIVR